MSSSTRHPWIYNVFINFRGQDTRSSFVSHLHAALSNAGIKTFLDDKDLPKGKELGPELKRAIEGSQICIVVLSVNYTKSSWCLNELLHIMDCRKNYGQLVLPVFFEIDPSFVRWQTGDFGEALKVSARRIEFFSLNKKKGDLLKKWKTALTEVANLSGWNSTSFGTESNLVKKIVDDILRKIDVSLLSITEFPIGLDSRLQSNNIKRETSSYVLDSDIIGREDDKKEIISLLKQPHGNQNVSLVAITGIGGLGKTALAQLVYNDAQVKNIFEKCMWVCVSNNFDVKTIVKKMLESLTKSKIDDTLSLDNLQNMLHDNLTGKRYFLVLDDLWNESFEKWTQLRTYLVRGAQGSKVVVTTRTKTVAQTMGITDPYVLNGLTPEESWGLLKNFITYGDDTKGVVNQTLESIGKKIAEKCRGVPLAIRTLGGLLQGKSEEREWNDILEGDFWKSCDDEESIMPVLKLSYQNLSPQLRQCFVYCSLYPKDWEIKKDELIQLWMAQGYLECSDENQLMEDIGNQIVKIFFMNSFFQDAETDRLGDIRSFKMHDLVHDLAMQLSGSNCCYLDSATKIPVRSPMHVMLKSDAISLLESLDASRTRTLILLSNFSETWNEKELSVISKFENLRVLKLSHCSLSKLCDLIGKLKHLRYLHLQYCEGLGSLFYSISSIVFLQTLILEGCKEVEFSTQDISKLINLRHFDIENFKASELKKTTSQFGKLAVGGQYNSVNFLNWFSSLTNIVQISLCQCLDMKYLPPMERLPFLKSLCIYQLHDLEFIYYEEPLLSESFFPSLVKLKFVGCEKLRGWRRMRDDVNDVGNSSQLYNLSFPRLSQLEIYLCLGLTHMPTFPKLDKTLSLTHSRVETLEATLNITASKCLIEFPPLSMLKYLYFGGFDLNVKRLPKDWVQNLTSLERLVIYDLGNKKFQEIEIWFKDDLNYLPVLRRIKFWNCSRLKTLPDWMCNLSSLQHITLLECKRLASLPKGMPSLTKLQTLEIIACPLLVKECETETSATWPKIAHIPNIILKS